MKNINYFNNFAIGLPLIILITYPIFKESALFFSLLSTMLTGLIQVIIGIKMFQDEPNNKHLQIYITSVILFFLLWFINSNLQYYEIMSFILFSIPPVLAIYLSLIIYKKTKS
jgi:hypothetical protein